MGTKGKEIVGVDVGNLIEMLNKALADEWLAYYQYWIGAKVIRGPIRGEAVTELEQHALDELRHAGMLVVRIIQLGGTPILKPEDWYKLTNCGYDAPVDPAVKRVLEQNVKGEQCAIGVYRAMIDAVKDKDDVTYNMALEILSNEVEHEEDLQALLEDIALIK
ncbi:MAG: ferritin [Armatimonadetes bacterium]|nr:ferritin [Armatimonadota bacterium]NIM24152.1 ferritin [Armatimonadota bacterium]NIM68011.1 ferritin [Armatimonadota bacterium]NIM76506.1 ferritin [Armatimonadota bacterium]NIN06245.1 ferritin [Armatimonadota bacterium]